MYRIAMDGIGLLHPGDLGAPLNADQLEALGEVDIALVPVGGYYTIDATQAVQLAQAVKARVVVPMHYRTEPSAKRLGVLAPVDDFLKAVPRDWPVTRSETNRVTIAKTELEEQAAATRVVVLNWQ